MKKGTFLLMILLIISIINTNAQSLFVYFNDGVVNEYPLSSVSKITFSNNNMILHKTDESILTWAISDIRKYNYNITTSIKEEDNLSNIDVLIYPNPSNGNFKIDYQVNQKGSVNISIIAADGRLIKNLFNANKNIGTYFLNYNSNLAAGNYFVKIQNENNITTKKIIILK